MAIEALKRVEVPVVKYPSEDIDVAVDALERVALVDDSNREEVRESVKADFEALDAANTAGPRYPALPRRLVSLHQIIKATDSGNYANGAEYPATYLDSDLWTPDNSQGYQAEELGNLEAGETDDSWAPHIRIAVKNPDSPYDKLLHFLGQPYDEKYAVKGEETQLEAIAKAKEAYESEHEGFALTPLNDSAFAMLSLMARIKGEEMPLASGWMRDATKGRKTVDGDSFVGNFRSNRSKLKFVRDNGNAYPHGGVGLSAGPKELSS